MHVTKSHFYDLFTSRLTTKSFSSTCIGLLNSINIESRTVCTIFTCTIKFFTTRNCIHLSLAQFKRLKRI